ncbi:peptidoglycan-binding domain-containing protein [Aeromicrobium sp.]|uniref:peptidoglycan-binding domain-containing protein n=1 Tax=Aeromicrobium sp. TaxID=1871063 RepID=UPI0030BB91B7
MRRLVIVLAALAMGAGLLASPALAGDPPVALASSPTGLRGPVALPSGVDPASPYLPQISCSPIDMPGVVKLQALVLKTYAEGRSGGISRGCTDGLSEHSEGRAWDWMVDVGDRSEKAAAADFLSWVTRNDGRNARRLGIMYVIYNKKIWSVYRAGEGWRTSSGHTDHVHVSFSWNGARGNTSFWTGKVGAIDYGPCVRFTGTYGARTSTPRTGSCPPSSGLLVKTSLGDRQYGRTGDTVAKAQVLLGVTKTSRFDAATWSAVKKYQRAHDIPYTGVLDQPTWASLSRSSVTSRVVSGYTRSEAVAYGLEHYSGSTIKRTNVGKATMFLQIALGLPAADRNGFFDTVTLAAVKKMQESAGLTQDGVVRGEEWRAMAVALR